MENRPPLARGLYENAGWIWKYRKNFTRQWRGFLLVYNLKNKEQNDISKKQMPGNGINGEYMSDNIISFKQVTKVYRNGQKALDRIESGD